MSAHGEAAEQVVDMATKATVKGVEVAANLTGKGLISLATFLIATLKEQKRTKGKTRIAAPHSKNKNEPKGKPALQPFAENQPRCLSCAGRIFRGLLRRQKNTASCMPRL